MSSSDIRAKEGDLVNLLCSAQGELPITFAWGKGNKTLDSFTETKTPLRSSLLVVTVKDETSFGKYICHIRDRFQTAEHLIWIQRIEGIYSYEDNLNFVSEAKAIHASVSAQFFGKFP